MLACAEEEVRGIQQVAASSKRDQEGQLTSPERGASERGAGVEDEVDAGTDAMRTHIHISLLAHLWVTATSMQ
jgi:hypothetical protein